MSLRRSGSFATPLSPSPPPAYICWQCSLRRSYRQLASRPSATSRHRSNLLKDPRRVFASSISSSPHQAADPVLASAAALHGGQLKSGRSSSKSGKSIYVELREWDEAQKLEERQRETESLRREDPETTSPLTKLLRDRNADQIVDVENAESDDGEHASLEALYDTSASESSRHLNNTQEGDLLVIDTGASGVGFGIHLGHHAGKMVNILILDEDGKLRIPSFWNAPPLFVLKGFAASQDLDRIRSFLPPVNLGAAQGSVIESISAINAQSAQGRNALKAAASSVLAAVSRLRLESDQVYLAHSKAFDNKSHILCADRHPKVMSISEIGKRVLGLSKDDEMTAPQKIAIWRSLLEAEPISAPAHDAPDPESVVIFSKRDVEICRLVKSWWHEYIDGAVAGHDQNSQLNTGYAHGASVIPPTSLNVPSGKNPIANFLARARELITLSRNNRPFLVDDRVLGPSKTQHKPRSFNERPPVASRIVNHGEWTLNEVVIIRFLELWAIKAYLPTLSVYAAIAPGLMKGTGCYEDLLCERIHGLIFLRELGVIAPWASKYFLNMALPENGVDADMTKLYYKAQNQIEASPPVDTMCDLRHDWEQLDVFCIDPAGSREIDDGISLETIKDDPLHVWLHVHVAHPTAFFGVDHPASKVARMMQSSFYGPTGTSPMLPDDFIRQHVSLDANRPCLTFSALLDSDGNIKQHQIRAAVIRNVHFLTYDTLREVITGENAPDRETAASLVVGNPRRKNHLPPSRPLRALTDLSKEQIQILKDLHQLMTIRHEMMKPSFTESFPWGHQRQRQTVKVDFADTSPINRSSRRTFEGDPTISVYPIPALDPSGYEEKVVSVAMSVACDVAGIWSAERRLPMPYFYWPPNPGYPPNSEYYETVIRPLVKSNQPVPDRLLTEYRLTQRLSAQLSVDPRINDMSKTPYVRTTSPMRRFTDMIAHWQIDSVLKRETRSHAAESADRDQAAFSREMVEQEIQKTQSIWESGSSSNHTLTERREKVFWTVQLLARALYFNECKLPDTFLATVTIPRTHNRYFDASEQWHATLEDLGIVATMPVDLSDETTRKALAGGTVQHGDTWDVELAAVLQLARPVTIVVKPRRLIKRLNAETASLAERLQMLKAKPMGPTIFQGLPKLHRTQNQIAS